MNKETEEIFENFDCEDAIDDLEWNGTWRKRNIKDIDEIIIHQSLSDGKLENINKYLISPGNHISPKNGCPHICYHIVINKKGEVILCNDIDDITWHTKKHNLNGLSICVLGNFNGTGWNKGHEPTDEQLDSLEELIEHLINKFNLSVKDIYGHYHFGKPACPGKTVSELIEIIRNNSGKTKEIKKFNKLDNVKDIQEALLRLGFELPKYGADGILGEETKLAICAFQIKYDLPLNGVADERTRDTIINQISNQEI